ncbi:MAG: 50S ribosomal protein L19e [Candidatus Jordarchaeales archaeon]
MNLSVQRRLAAEILNVGVNRVWFDPEKLEEISAAVTREDVRSLIKQGAIKAKPKLGISRARAKERYEKRKRGQRRGMGSRKGKATARMPMKEKWMMRIRAIRAFLKHLRARRIITQNTYRKLYKMAKGGAFESVAYLKNYIKDKRLARK